jgi:hypothetical protein
MQVVTPRTLAAFRGPALVLPNVAVLDESERRALQGHVARGMRLVVTGADAVGSGDRRRFPECPGAAYLAALERDLASVPGPSADELTSSLALGPRITVEAAPMVVAQVARVDGRVHVFLANFSGLVPGRSATQTPQSVRVTIPEATTARGSFVPFLGQARPVEGTLRGKDRVFELPAIEKGAVFALEP